MTLCWIQYSLTFLICCSNNSISGCIISDLCVPQQLKLCGGDSFLLQQLKYKQAATSQI
ncbi:hypothetical protein SEVIR_3G195550v4 [Setaria viridis]|uniref:Uncharacterized protein n=1 Tax=Setaria viridis TaxID=4556 RepID=A0A4U6VB00_SETVI|nr:hypothetical protein SEVIR_3G195550v2 [Setaria viridis]